jgi:hypothetical protein
MSVCSRNHYFTFLSQTNMSKRHNRSCSSVYGKHACYDTSPMPLKMKRQLKYRTQWIKVSHVCNYTRYVYAKRYITRAVIEQRKDGVFVHDDETLMKSFKPRMLGLTDEPFHEIYSKNCQYSGTELGHIYWNLLKEYCDEQKKENEDESEDENEDESKDESEDESKDESEDESGDESEDESKYKSKDESENE